MSRRKAPAADAPTTVAEAVTPKDGLLTPAQCEALRAAMAWWQEGERALDYLAELGRHETTLARLRPLLEDLRSAPTAAMVAPILRHVRHLSANRALNRTLETDAFAGALCELLYSAESLPERLAAFLQTQRVGPQTASHLLYAAAPDRFPLVSPATRQIIAPTAAQRAAARERTNKRYGVPASDAEVATLLADFELYEAARSAMRAQSFVEVNAALWHAREMPTPKPRKPARNAFATATAVRESARAYEASGDGVPEATEADLVNLLEAHVAAQGFTFPELAVRDYYIALKAKPFVILSGLSGTGKTRLTHLLAEAITGGTAPDQYLLLPVRPDWTDGTALFGYHNVVADRYVSTPFLDLLTRAGRGENRDRAFFVCLDEMNLARVEHYLADLLSAMEAPAPRRIPLHENRAALLPDNVSLTGSVNIDEATHPFSRKVLDRANTIEFSQVSLAQAADPTRRTLPTLPPHERQRLFLAGRVPTVAAARERLSALDPASPDRAIAALSDLNTLLEERGMHFGYRVRDEALRYLAASFTAEGVGLLDATDRERNLLLALDLQIVQKVLPRLSGTEEALGGLLKRVEAWATQHAFSRAADKLARMRRRAQEDGLVSFYEL
jgi:MoxR-like ATPase